MSTEANKAVFVGIDPGLTGAIAIIDHTSRPILVTDVATRRRKAKETAIRKEIDAFATAGKMADRLVNYPEHELHGCIEMPFTFPDAKIMSIASLFQSYGSLLAILQMLEIETLTISPSDWKRGFGLTKDKDQSLVYARAMWPSVDLSKKLHHNQAEALLIAEYGRLTWKQNETIRRSTNG